MWIRSGLGVSVLYNSADHTIWIWRDAWAHIRTNVVLPHYSLLTGQYQAKRVIRLVYVCSVSTSLLFIDRSVPSQESDPSCMCVLCFYLITLYWPASTKPREWSVLYMCALFLPHYSLLTGQYQAKRVIRLVYVVIDRSVPSQESDPSCICVLCFYDFVLDLFRNCSDSVFYFHIITCNIPEHP